MFKSKDIYTITINRSVDEITEIIKLNTLYRSTLSWEHTVRSFIGKTDANGFRVLGSAPIGMLCVSTGKFVSDESSSTLKIETELPKLFRILLICWAIVIGCLFISAPFMPGSNATFSFATVIWYLFLVMLFRLFLHKAYTMARDQRIKAIETLLYQ